MRGLLLAFVLVALTVQSLPFSTAESQSSFQWSTREHLNDTAARLTITIQEATDCTFAWGMGGSQQEHGGGILFYYVERRAGDTLETYGSGVVSAYDSHQLHAGPVDSRGPVNVADQVTLFPTGTWGADGSVAGPFPAGTYDFTAGGIDLHATSDDPERLGYHALAFDVSCDAPFTIDGFAGSHEVLLFSPANMGGGVGFYESLVVQVNVGDRAERDFSSSQVESHVWWKEYQDGGHAYGTLERTTPEGTTAYDLTDPAEVRIRDATGPGLHRYVLDRVALDFFATFSGVTYGLDEIGSLEAVIPAGTGE